MEKNKQTAVGWLIDYLRNLAFDKHHHLGLGDIRLTQGMIDDIEEQAKQMEMEQRVDDYNVGYADATCRYPNSAFEHIDGKK